MKGSAFIVHNNTWSCSNEVILQMFSTPLVDESKKLIAIKEEKTINIYGIFNAEKQPEVGDKCEVVMMDDDKGLKYGFIGIVRAVGQLTTIINIVNKTEKINEILTNITFKN